MSRRRRPAPKHQPIAASGSPASLARTNAGREVVPSFMQPVQNAVDEAYRKAASTATIQPGANTDHYDATLRARERDRALRRQGIGIGSPQVQRRVLPAPGERPTTTRLRSGLGAQSGVESKATREIKRGRPFWTHELQEWYDAYLARAHTWLQVVEGTKLANVVEVLWSLPAPADQPGTMPLFDPPTTLQLRADHMGVVEVKVTGIYGLVRLRNPERDVCLLLIDADNYMVLIDPITTLVAPAPKERDTVRLYDPQAAEIYPKLPREWRALLDTMTMGDPWRTHAGIVPAQYSAIYDAMLTTARLCAGSHAIVATAHSPKTKDYTEGTMAVIGLAFENAEPYYWAPDMCDALMALTATAPLGILQKSDLPTPAGFSWFAKPLAMPGYQDANEPLVSVLWYTTPGASRLALTFFTRTAAYPVGEVLATSYLNFDQPIQRAIDAFAVSKLDPVALRSVTEDHGGDAEAAHSWRANAEQALRYFCASLALMAQRITVTSRQLGERTTVHRYRAEKRIEPELVRVITLRKREYDARPSDGDAREVAWRCRWMVGYPFGHWRLQKYGDGSVKKILIAPFIKGPPDMPFKGPPKAGILRAVVE